MLDTERRQQLVELVEQRNSLTVAELSDYFKVSAATIRRDLSQLSQRGMIERAHGGAAKRVRVAAEMPEPPLLKRSSLQSAEKRRIGRAAAAHVHDGETIIISSGTTTAEMVPYLADRHSLTVITNALNIVLALAPFSSITVIVLGGVLRHSELTVLGSLAEDAMENLRADKLFMGSPAIHADYGLSAENFAESRSDQTLMNASREVIVLADHTKFGRVATVRVSPLKRIRRIITGIEIASNDAHLPNEQDVVIELV
ncbi:MAG: DeoR/GlpR transcriptional regulator [Chloroflexia bacterium]|nr:DeoR/GlpR transcriptional regulator [Chloroflexia bacterium]